MKADKHLKTQQGNPKLILALATVICRARTVSYLQIEGHLTMDLSLDYHTLRAFCN